MTKNLDYEFCTDEGKSYFEEELLNELLYHKITSVNYEANILTLDNGVKLYFIGNEGCGGCTSGNYDITEFNPDVVDNAITNVKLVEEPLTSGEWQDNVYELFIYTENKEMKLLRCEGTDGNGYYGSGFRVKVIFPE